MTSPGVVFDAEFNGLTPDKVHCLSANFPAGTHTVFKYPQIAALLREEGLILVGHNIFRYDVVFLQKILGVTIKAKLIDTLFLSWYLYPNRVRHGLADWGEEFGIPKPAIDDWEGLTPEEYQHRCEEDVKINQMLWDKIWKDLLKLYGSEAEAWRLIDYLMFKADCAAEQERSRWRLDIPRCEGVLEKLTEERDAKVEALTKVMPKLPVYATIKLPKKMYKINGDMTVAYTKYKEAALDGEKYDQCRFTGDLEYIKEYDDPNPNSHKQVKDWLYSLGWKPETFKFVRDKDTNDVRKIPQVRKDTDDGKVLCDSVLRLIVKESGVEVLNGLTVLNHRISILQGFLDNVDEEGYVMAQIQGLTNTLRFIHKVVLNLPGVDKAYGEDVRGCLIAPEGYELCGSDMSGLEDRTKQHYMYPHDPEYVKEMSGEGYDPHLSLAVSAGALTEAQSDAHKDGTKKQSVVRHTYKQANYSCVYGAGGPTVARAAGIPDRKGQGLVDAYWKKNWSVLKIAEECVTKKCLGGKWLFNPVSKLWYSLRHEKDRFSTLNQGTGVFCFDMWVKKVRERRSQLTGQMHDEIILTIKKGFRDKAEALLLWAINEVNEELDLNIDLAVDIQFGDTYAEIH